MKAVAIALAVVCFVTCPAYANHLVLADFDSGEKPNNVGGNFGAWDKDPEDFTQAAWEEFNTDDTRQGTGYCMMVEYDVDSPNPAYNGFWIQFEGMDASAYDTLSMWVKTDEVKGGASRFKIELKTAGERGAYYLEGISSEWTQFKIPLFDFLISDYSELWEMVIVFEDHTASPKEGFVYIDDIALENSEDQATEEPVEAAPAEEILPIDSEDAEADDSTSE